MYNSEFGLNFSLTMITTSNPELDMTCEQPRIKFRGIHVQLSNSRN